MENLVYPVILVLSLGVILFGCAVFTNGIEWVGKKLDLSHGATGSILAAVGTALPETMIPVIALVAGNRDSLDIAVGAIAGAPFMLATLGFFVNGAAVYWFASRGRRSNKLKLDMKVKVRDLTAFLLIYTTAILTTFLPTGTIRYLIAACLALSYFVYMFITLKHEGESHGELDALYLARMFGLEHKKRFILTQVFFSLGLIVLGAHYFVVAVERVSDMIGIPTVLLALIITPIATELPEKMNSVLWIRDRKDTLALGNITGAMVFQASFPVAIGVAFTPWHLAGPTMVSALIAIASSAIVLGVLLVKKRLNPAVLLLGGVFYLGFMGYLMMGM